MESNFPYYYRLIVHVSWQGYKENLLIDAFGCPWLFLKKIQKLFLEVWMKLFCLVSTESYVPDVCFIQSLSSWAVLHFFVILLCDQQHMFSLADHIFFHWGGNRRAVPDCDCSLVPRLLTQTQSCTQKEVLLFPVLNKVDFMFWTGFFLRCYCTGWCNWITKADSQAPPQDTARAWVCMTAFHCYRFKSSGRNFVSGFFFDCLKVL